MTGLCKPKPCTQWKLPGYRNPKAEPDHLHYICDTEEKRFPRNRLLPLSLEDSIHLLYHIVKQSKQVSRGGASATASASPQQVSIHAVAIIPQIASCVSYLMKKTSSFFTITITLRPRGHTPCHSLQVRVYERVHIARQVPLCIPRLIVRTVVLHVIIGVDCHRTDLCAEIGLYI